MSVRITREPSGQAVASINWLLRNDLDQQKRKLYLADLLHKAESMTDRGDLMPLAKALANFLPEELQIMVDSALNRRPDEPAIQDVDVAIVTIKTPELSAAKIAFDATNSPRPLGNYFFYEGTFPNQLDMRGAGYSYVLTAVGVERNVPCTSCVNALMRYFRPKICVLIGMAAGNESKTKLGDVVTANSVWDIAGGREEIDGKKPRPEPFRIDPLVRAQLTIFEQKLWPSLLTAKIETLKKSELPPENIDNWQPTWHQAVVFSGETVVVDGSLPLKRDQYHEQGIALDMEASGFAQACEDHKVPWIIFRGISDFGEPTSKDGTTASTTVRRKAWQPYATLAAACIARDFLSSRHGSEPF